MSAAPVVDPVVFVNRLERLYSSWEAEEQEEENQWRKVDALSVVVGKDEDILYSKSAALQTWLFGYELADTLCVFCANDIHILSSKKKIEFLRPLESALAKRNDLPDLQLHMRNKADKDAENFQKIAEAMKKSKKVRTAALLNLYSSINMTVCLSLSRARTSVCFRRMPLLGSLWTPGRAQWLQ